MTAIPFTTPISRLIWETKYRWRDGDVVHDRTIEDSWRRIARALAAVEKTDAPAWEERFLSILRDFRFLPGGRIQAGAGTGRRVTLFNCFVMGAIEDSMDGIFEALKQGALTMQQGGGVGYDFSTLRPQGMAAKSVGSVASGPVSFMRIWDAMCATLLSVGSRRGAMMATLRCDHPDIEEFIDAKRAHGSLRHFNLSVLVSDAFLDAVRQNQDWPLIFPANGDDAGGEIVQRTWSGRTKPIPCRVIRRIPARRLWDRIMRATYDYAEPGVLFIDRINEWNNLWYRENISATNPCGELPLPPYGACDLGSINLTAFVQNPFKDQAHIDLAAIANTARLATRLMDNAIDASLFPLPAQADQARGTRRIGLGLTGLADTLIMLGLHYGEEPARALAARVMQTICHATYGASIELAGEKGAFPFLDRGQYLQGPFIRSLPPELQQGIAEHGIRNSHLTAIAPTGTISLLANNISSGLEPVYDFSYSRRMTDTNGQLVSHELRDEAFRFYREQTPDGPLPPAFVASHQLAPEAHLAMQAALQPFVDSSISKTINVPTDYSFTAFQNIYSRAYDLGLKGCTTFRPNPVTGEILSREAEPVSHCCNIDREAD